MEHLRDMIVLLQRLLNRREVQALESIYLDYIVLQAPMFGLQWDNVVHIFEQTRNRVCRAAVGAGDAPDDVRSRQTVPLDCQPQAHDERVKIRVALR